MAKEEIIISKKIIIIAAAIAIVGVFSVIAALTLGSGNANAQAANNNAQYNGQVQEVKLSYDWNKYAYVMEPSSLKKGVKARVTVDMSTVQGCMRDIAIDSFGVRKLAQEGNNVFEFTPDKAGTFMIHCSMYMGRGQFTVVDDSGSAGTYKETLSAPAGGTCGAGGGCGCGARPLNK